MSKPVRCPYCRVQNKIDFDKIYDNESDNCGYLDGGTVYENNTDTEDPLAYETKYQYKCIYCNEIFEIAFEFVGKAKKREYPENEFSSDIDWIREEKENERSI